MLYNAISKAIKNPGEISPQKEIRIDLILLAYATITFLFSWEHIAMDTEPFSWDNTFKDFVLGILGYSILFILFYLASCWIFVQEKLSELKGNYQSFLLSFLLLIVLGLLPLFW